MSEAFEDNTLRQFSYNNIWLRPVIDIMRLPAITLFVNPDTNQGGSKPYEVVGEQFIDHVTEGTNRMLVRQLTPYAIRT